MRLAGRQLPAACLACPAVFDVGEWTPATLKTSASKPIHWEGPLAVSMLAVLTSMLTHCTHSMCTMTCKGLTVCTFIPCRSTPPAVLQPRIVAAQAAAEVLAQRPGFRRPASAQTAAPHAHIMHAIRGSKGSRPPSAGGTNLVQGRRLRQGAQ